MRKLLALVLLLALLTGVVSAAGAQPPYAIEVNRTLNTVTVYALDENGQHTVPYKAMICSTARAGHTTPLGTYRLAEYRSEWRLMLDGTYGQYATSFSGHYLFHSICYSDDSHDAMKREAYNALGSAASMGCVRLETADAKWIFDNCPAGTPVMVYEDHENPGPLGKPERTVDVITEEMHNGWDPTDPAEGNPWRTAAVTGLTVEPPLVDLRAGEAIQLKAAVEPEQALVFWTSSDEAVARVDSRGRVTAISEGNAVILAQGLNGVSAACAVRVTGALLPFNDLVPGAWYYPEVRQAVERGLFQGGADRTFSPNGDMTRAMVVQVLYNLEGRPAVKKDCAFADVAAESWYHHAVAWAASQGIVTGVSGTEFAPDQAMTRQELAAVLWRYAGQPRGTGSLYGFADRREVRPYAQEALSWMTGAGLMQGEGDRLRPNDTATRVETAVMLQRFANEG